LIASNASTSQVLGDRITLALKFTARLRGLMWRPPLEEGEGLWIVPCNSIHMFSVRFPLDILFLDEELRIVGAAPELPPNRIRGQRGACSVLELPAGTIARTGTQVGHVVSFTGVREA
jgi:uncharacterized membrane protein (UPF0127 family)